MVYKGFLRSTSISGTISLIIGQGKNNLKVTCLSCSEWVIESDSTIVFCQNGYQMYFSDILVMYSTQYCDLFNIEILCEG